jgi:hypothetical protein
VFDPGKPFQPSLKFASSQDPTRVDNSSCVPLSGRLLFLPVNIWLGLEDLPGTTTLAYLIETLVNYKGKTVL